MVVPVLKATRHGHTSAVSYLGREAPPVADVLVGYATGHLHLIGDELVRVRKRGEHCTVSAQSLRWPIHASVPVLSTVAEDGVGEDVLLANIVPLESSKCVVESEVAYIAFVIRRCWSFGDAGTSIEECCAVIA